MKYLTLTANGAIRICNLKDYICLRNVTSKSSIDWHSFFPVIFLSIVMQLIFRRWTRSDSVPASQCATISGSIASYRWELSLARCSQLPVRLTGPCSAKWTSLLISLKNIWGICDKTTNQNQHDGNSFDEKVKTWPSSTCFTASRPEFSTEKICVTESKISSVSGTCADKFKINVQF